MRSALNRFNTGGCTLYHSCLADIPGMVGRTVYDSYHPVLTLSVFIVLHAELPDPPMPRAQPAEWCR